MLSITTASRLTASSPRIEYRKVDLTGLGASRNEFGVVNIDRAFDGNDDTYADGAFFGAGQGILVTLPEPIRIGKARLVADVFYAPGNGHCTMSFGGTSIQTLPSEGKAVKEWIGDLTISSIDVEEYARTYIYAIEIWELIEHGETS